MKALGEEAALVAVDRQLDQHQTLHPEGCDFHGSFLWARPPACLLTTDTKIRSSPLPLSAFICVHLWFFCSSSDMKNRRWTQLNADKSGGESIRLLPPHHSAACRSASTRRRYRP